jgi:hypothetical protein
MGRGISHPQTTRRSTHIKIAIIGAGNAGRTLGAIPLALRRGFGTDFGIDRLPGRS